LGLGKITGLQILAELGEKLSKRIRRSAQASGMMMVAVRGRSGRLQILLNGGVVLLAGREIARFEIGRQLIEGRGEAVGGEGRRKARDMVGFELRDPGLEKERSRLREQTCGASLVDFGSASARLAMRPI
jgi:hypothetical protein